MAKKEQPKLPEAVTSLKDQRWTDRKGGRHVLMKAETIKVGDGRGQLEDEVARELLAMATVVPAGTDEAKDVETAAKVEANRKAAAAKAASESGQGKK